MYHTWTHLQCHLSTLRFLAPPGTHCMPGGQEHVVFSAHSPRRSHRGQKYGPRSFHTKRMGQVARRTSHDFTSSQYSGGSPSGSCSWSALPEVELFSRALRARTVLRSDSSSMSYNRLKYRLNKRYQRLVQTLHILYFVLKFEKILFRNWSHYNK